jgi:hypothetical protein
MQRPGPNSPATQPRNWLELASIERQTMDYHAAGKDAAAEFAAAIESLSPAAQRRREQAVALHDERLVLQSIARSAYLGALGAHVEQRAGSFAPDQLPQREAEAKLVGHVIGSFVTAAQLLTGVDSLRRSGLASTAAPLQQEAEFALNRGFVALRLQQAGHKLDKQRRPNGPVYEPPFPTTIMNVVIQEVPALPTAHRVALLQMLLPQMSGRN